MATLQQRRSENVSGNFYVDRSCINCDTCRWMAPSVYSQEGSQSIVYHQPSNEKERILALEALLACPTAFNWYGRKAKRYQSPYSRNFLC